MRAEKAWMFCMFVMLQSTLLVLNKDIPSFAIISASLFPHEIKKNCGISLYPTYRKFKFGYFSILDLISMREHLTILEASILDRNISVREKS